MSKKPLTENQLLEKASKYCAYQERSESDLRKRLKTWDAGDDVADRIIKQLRDENFISDKRFAESFTKGRFLLKKWGRVKIRYALLQHGISEPLATEVLHKIDDEEYLETLRHLMTNRMRGIHSPSLKDKSKTFNFLRSKGYEFDLIHTAWEEFYSDK